jgi:hypothetical protein
VVSRKKKSTRRRVSGSKGLEWIYGRLAWGGGGGCGVDTPGSGERPVAGSGE